MATCWYVIVFCWTFIAVDCTISAVVLRSLWMVVIACVIALRLGVFWNLVYSRDYGLKNGFGTGWSSVESILTSAFLR
jgi:ABC-type phosphate transport system permease subunit